MVVSLGALGVVTRLTLDILPTFDVRQDVYRDLPLASLESHFDDVMASGYSVSLFTDWRGETINQVWVKRRVGDPARSELETLGAARAANDLHPIASISPENCTKQMGVPGPWHERLPHFRLEYTPSAGEELQSEYFVPRESAVEALRAIRAIRDRVSPLLQISEIRSIADDNLWMSPCYGRASVAIHFTWRKDWPGVSAVLPAIEAQLAPFEARPHWGKLFRLDATTLRQRYPRMEEFQRLAHELDPTGKFRNRFLRSHLAN
jgi:xylitol oxidase